MFRVILSYVNIIWVQGQLFAKQRPTAKHDSLICCLTQTGFVKACTSESMQNLNNFAFN